VQSSTSNLDSCLTRKQRITLSSQSRPHRINIGVRVTVSTMKSGFIKRLAVFILPWVSRRLGDIRLVEGTFPRS